MRKEKVQKRVFLSWLETLKAAAIMFHPPFSDRSHTSSKKKWIAFAPAVNDSKRSRVCISTSFGDLRKRKISLSLGTNIFSLFFIYNKKWSVPECTTPCFNDNQEDSNHEEADEGPEKPGRKWRLCQSITMKANASSQLVRGKMGAQRNLIQRDDKQLEPLSLKMSKSFRQASAKELWCR